MNTQQAGTCHSTSGWRSFPKRHGGWHVCIDDRTLSKLTSDSIGGLKYMTRIASFHTE